MRAFTNTTTLDPQGLSLALAPGLNPEGYVESPSFFQGFATQPQVLARGLVTLADITATRYYKITPEAERDPILSAHGDRLRAECFSACNSVYACLEIFDSALDGGDIARGATNVDIGPESRKILTNLGAHQLLHLNVGAHGLRASTPVSTLEERPVDMPARWVPALGNVAGIMRDFTEALRVSAGPARAFIAGLPAASAQSRSAWVSLTRQQFKTSTRPVPGAVFIPGIHRLSALKRMLSHVQGLTVYRPVETAETVAGAVVSVEFTGARITLALTDEAWRGFSGEGSLLVDLAGQNVRDDAELISALLAFEPVIDVARLARESGLDSTRVDAGLAVLAGAGRVGWDPHESAYFHRELPDDPDQVFTANSRLRAAKQLVAEGRVGMTDDGWLVRSTDNTYLVTLGANRDAPEVGAVCGCHWYLQHGGNRGPCKHILAAILAGKE